MYTIVLYFLPLDEPIASRAVIATVSGADGHAETFLEPGHHCGIFDGFFRDKFGPEVFIDVISSFAVALVRLDVSVKFGDSTSNRFRDIRVDHFVMDERRMMPADGPCCIWANGLWRFAFKRHSAFCLTRRPPIGAVRQNVALFYFKTSTDIQCVSIGHLSSNLERVMSLPAGPVLRT